MRRAVAASCCHGRVASTSAAASAAARPSHSCSTPSARAATATTTSARPAGCTSSGTAPGSALPARRAGMVGAGGSVACLCVCVCLCVSQVKVVRRAVTSVVLKVLTAAEKNVCSQPITVGQHSQNTQRLAAKVCVFRDKVNLFEIRTLRFRLSLSVKLSVLLLIICLTHC